MSDEAPRLTVLPPNCSLLEAGLDLAFDKLLEQIRPPFPELMNPQAAPVDFLPYLAADRGVNEWLSTAPESQKRATVASAWAVKRQAGTRAALTLAVESLGFEAEVEPWHLLDPPAPPYWLKVSAIVEGAYSALDHGRLMARLLAAKSERDHLVVNLISETKGRLYAGAYSDSGSTTTVYPYREPVTEVFGGPLHAASASLGSIVTVYPMREALSELAALLHWGGGLIEESKTTVYPQ